MKTLLSLVTVLGLLSFVGCGGGDDSANGVESMMDQLVALNQQYKAGGVSADEFAIQGANVMAAIDGLANGPADLTSYLETKAYGGSLPAGDAVIPAGAVKHIGPAGWTVSLTQIFSNVNDAVTYVANSDAYAHVHAFVGSVIGQFVYDAPGFMLSVADPDAVVGFVTYDAFMMIERAYYGPTDHQISFEEYEELRAILNSSNPVAAEKRLLEMQGKAIPAVLSPWNTSTPMSIEQATPPPPPTNTDQPNTGRFSGTYTGYQNSEMTVPQPGGYPSVVIAEPTTEITITISGGQARLGAITAPLDGVNGNHFALTVSASSMGITVPGGMVASLTYEGTISLTDDSIDGTISGASGVAPYIITTAGTFNLYKE